MTEPDKEMKILEQAAMNIFSYGSREQMDTAEQALHLIAKWNKKDFEKDYIPKIIEILNKRYENERQNEKVVETEILH